MLRGNLQLVILLGTLIRLLLIPFTAHPFDMYSWYKECMGVLERGIDVNGILSSIRPLWFLTLIPVAYLYGFLSSITGIKAISVGDLSPQMNPHYGIAFVPDPLFNTLVKIPILMADVATTVVLFKLVEKFFGREKAGWASMIFFLNPISIWISSAWGQYDSIPAFFTVLSLYLLLERRIISSALSLLVATLFKVYPAIFLIPVSIYLLKKIDRRSLLKYYVIFLAPIFPILLIGGMGLVDQFLELGLYFDISTYTSTSIGVFGFGLTYWSISMLFPLNPSVWAPFSILLTVILLSISTYYVSKVKFSVPMRGLVISTFLLFAVGLLSLRRVGETRFTWLLPFLILMITEGVLSKKMYVFLSLISFMYAQKNFPHYLLPIATINQEALKPLFVFANPFGKVVEKALLPTPMSAAVLAILGTTFSFLILKVYMKIIRKIPLNQRL